MMAENDRFRSALNVVVGFDGSTVGFYHYAAIGDLRGDRLTACLAHPAGAAARGT